MSAATTSIRLDDSPLHGNRAGSPLPPPDPLLSTRTSKSGAELRSESSALEGEAGDDGLPTARHPSIQHKLQGQRGHRTRPSASWLLGDTSDETDDFSSETERRQRRLRSYGTDNGGRSLARFLPSWQPPRAVSSFVDRNQGARGLLFHSSDLGRRLTSIPVAGLLLIAASQLGFALVNTCVKLLERDVQVPVWELIVIRMFSTMFSPQSDAPLALTFASPSVTYVGCYSYLRWSGDPHPFAGPPGVRLLLALRGFIGFFGYVCTHEQ